MAHFKRKRHKAARAGCLHCKPHKGSGADRRTLQERRADEYELEDESPVTAIVCRVADHCPVPELCQEECFERDLAEWWKEEGDA